LPWLQFIATSTSAFVDGCFFNVATF
jgi:hypothetical protein